MRNVPSEFVAQAESAARLAETEAARLRSLFGVSQPEQSSDANGFPAVDPDAPRPASAVQTMGPETAVVGIQASPHDPLYFGPDLGFGLETGFRAPHSGASYYVFNILLE